MASKSPNPSLENLVVSDSIKDSSDCETKSKLLIMADGHDSEVANYDIQKDTNFKRPREIETKMTDLPHRQTINQIDSNKKKKIEEEIKGQDCQEKKTKRKKKMEKEKEKINGQDHQEKKKKKMEEEINGHEDHEEKKRKMMEKEEFYVREHQAKKKKNLIRDFVREKGDENIKDEKRKSTDENISDAKGKKDFYKDLFVDHVAREGLNMKSLDSSSYETINNEWNKLRLLNSKYLRIQAEFDAKVFYQSKIIFKSMVDSPNPIMKMI